MRTKRQTAETAKALPLGERKAIFRVWKKSAKGKAKAGARFIEIRDLRPDEKAAGESLGPRAKEILARSRARKAA